MTVAGAGSCLCGDVVFEVARFGEPMYHCHCSMCRKHHGSPFATGITVAADDLHWIRGARRVARYESSPDLHRQFCSRCGSTLPNDDREGRSASVPAGLLDGDCGLRPACHIFAADKAPWYEITDGLPQFARLPPGYDLPGFEPAPRGADGPALGGSCLCGAVRFELAREPDGMMNCFCHRCQKSRSAAHATNLFIDRSGFRFVAGEDLIRTYEVPDAARFASAFCIRCGSQVPALWSGWGSALIPAGSMDDAFESRPIGNIYVADKAPWYEITNDLPRFEQGRPGR